MAMKCALYSSETKGSIKYVHDLNILNSWGFKLKVILYQVLAWNTVIKYPATMLIPWVFILYQNKKKQGRSLLKLCKLRSQSEIHDMSIMWPIPSFPLRETEETGRCAVWAREWHFQSEKTKLAKFGKYFRTKGRSWFISLFITPPCL